MSERHSIGTDPEFFIKKGGEYISAEPHFPGTKDEPFIMKTGAGLQTDNVAVEFASPVGKDGKDFVDKLQATFHELFAMLPEDMTIDMAASAEFAEDQLQTPQAQAFGCSPSYDAWRLCENEQPNATRSNLRSTGAHIHIGVCEGDGNDFLHDPYGKVNVVKMCDAFHGIISVTLDTDVRSVKRRELYGKAGEHRPTTYGVEYRTLSSFWLRSPNLVMLIDSLTSDALKMVREEKHEDVIAALGGADKIQSIINTGDVASAEKAIEVLMQFMSEDSKYFLKECKPAMATYDFKKEWKISA
ncbi:hypothetical protein JZU46_04650 [bacterium]|nr:hypothetical protein [bacterium]